METETMTKTTFTLPNKKVLVVPVRRKGRWLPDNHEASFLFKHSYFQIVVPKDGRNGELRDPLNQEERDYFESKASGLALQRGDLSTLKKDDNYWTNFRVKLDKNVLQLNLSDPMDYIRYKVLTVNTDIIAPSSKEKYAKGTYRFAIVEEDYQHEERVKAASEKKTAYKFFGKIDNSPTKMKDFLNVYYTQKPGGKQVPPNAKKEFLIAEIEKLIEVDLLGFLKLADDKDYDKKVLIFTAQRAGALVREGMTFKIPEGSTIGDNLQEVISFFDNPANSEEVIKLKARIENSK
jgi:hypothetical protein